MGGRALPPDGSGDEAQVVSDQADMSTLGFLDELLDDLVLDEGGGE